ncbi:NAD-dependent epimerase/dehydratase family protein [Candidatus Pelagibacter sp.]|nr:NAD-dependent epimerase/dehydratase family protein [Candidatus Pelagibacter sp.]
MPNILLTGATGFIGSNILKEIRLNNKVFIIQRFESKKKIKKTKNIKIITFKNYNILSNKLKKIKVDTIIHCATHYKKEHIQKDILKFIQSNILLGNIILENLKTLNAKQFINFSTTWEDFDNKENNPRNLYAAYKKSFNCLIQYYKKKIPNINFIDLMIVDTFGENDKRQKLINTLRNNYIKKRTSKIISKKLYLNLINVEDIVNAVKILLKNKIQPGKYILKNSNYFNLFELIEYINKNNNNNRIKVKWLSNTLIKDKILKYKKLKNWNPKKSNIKNVKDLILN